MNHNPAVPTNDGVLDSPAVSASFDALLPHQKSLFDLHGNLMRPVMEGGSNQHSGTSHSDVSRSATYSTSNEANFMPSFSGAQVYGQSAGVNVPFVGIDNNSIMYAGVRSHGAIEDLSSDDEEDATVNRLAGGSLRGSQDKGRSSEESRTYAVAPQDVLQDDETVPVGLSARFGHRQPSLPHPPAAIQRLYEDGYEASSTISGSNHPMFGSNLTGSQSVSEGLRVSSTMMGSAGPAYVQGMNVGSGSSSYPSHHQHHLQQQSRSGASPLLQHYGHSTSSIPEGTSGATQPPQYRIQEINGQLYMVDYNVSSNSVAIDNSVGSQSATQPFLASQHHVDPAQLNTVYPSASVLQGSFAVQQPLRNFSTTADMHGVIATSSSTPHLQQSTGLAPLIPVRSGGAESSHDFQPISSHSSKSAQHQSSNQSYNPMHSSVNEFGTPVMQPQSFHYVAPPPVSNLPAAFPQRQQQQPPKDHGAALRSPDNVFVCMLALNVRKQHVMELFAPFGDIISCEVRVDIHTGVSKGHGFIKFSRPESADRAVAALDGFMFHGRRLQVRHADAHADMALLKETHTIFVRNVPVRMLHWERVQDSHSVTPNQALEHRAENANDSANQTQAAPYADGARWVIAPNPALRAVLSVAGRVVDMKPLGVLNPLPPFPVDDPAEEAQAIRHLGRKVTGSATSKDHFGVQGVDEPTSKEAYQQMSVRCSSHDAFNVATSLICVYVRYEGVAQAVRAIDLLHNSTPFATPEFGAFKVPLMAKMAESREQRGNRKRQKETMQAREQLQQKLNEGSRGGPHQPQQFGGPHPNIAAAPFAQPPQFSYHGTTVPMADHQLHYYANQARLPQALSGGYAAAASPFGNNNYDAPILHQHHQSPVLYQQQRGAAPSYTSPNHNDASNSSLHYQHQQHHFQGGSRQPVSVFGGAPAAPNPQQQPMGGGFYPAGPQAVSEMRNAFQPQQYQQPQYLYQHQHHAFTPPNHQAQQNAPSAHMYNEAQHSTQHPFQPSYTQHHSHQGRF